MSIKEIWDKLKYWQRGGVVTAMIGAVLVYPSIYERLIHHPEEIGFYRALFESILYSPLFILFFIPLSFESSEFSMLLGRVIIIFNYFIVGAAFGHLYSELKNPTPSSDKSRLMMQMLSRGILLFYILTTALTLLLYLFYT